MRTLYIDCSYLAEHVGLNTGIQRVVRRVIENLEELAPGVNLRIQPVKIGSGQFQPLSIEELYPQTPPPQPPSPAEETTPFIYKAANYLRSVYIASRELVAAICGHHPAVRRFLFKPRNEMGLGYIVDNLTLRPMRYLLKRRDNSGTTDNFSLIKTNDILLLLDSTWYSEIWPSVAKARQKGVKVVAVIYDLIPITHPQFCDNFLATVFKNWFHDSLEHVDKYIGISQTVQKDLHAYMLKEFGEQINGKAFDFFHLGADFKYRIADTSHVRQDVVEVMAQRPAYLIVSTVEPRKNHAYLLDAFDRLWEQGSNVSLVIVGRTGWKVEPLMERINQHPENGKHLHYWHDLNDDELFYCYQHAKMLLFPSIVEGFGLPIVEGLSNRLPVMVSDTPIHREVGGNRVGYFDLESPDDLYNKITKIEKEGIPEELLVPADYKWLNWHESTEQLLEKTLQDAAN